MTRWFPGVTSRSSHTSSALHHSTPRRVMTTLLRSRRAARASATTRRTSLPTTYSVDQGLERRTCVPAGADRAGAAGRVGDRLVAGAVRSGPAQAGRLPLRSKTLTGVLQEAWAALSVQQVLRPEAGRAAGDSQADRTDRVHRPGRPHPRRRHPHRRPPRRSSRTWPGHDERSARTSPNPTCASDATTGSSNTECRSSPPNATPRRRSNHPGIRHRHAPRHPHQQRQPTTRHDQQLRTRHLDSGVGPVPGVQPGQVSRPGRGVGGDELAAEPFDGVE